MSSISDLSTLQTGHDDNLSTVQGGGIASSSGGKAASASVSASASAGAGGSQANAKQRASLTPASDVANMSDLADVCVHLLSLRNDGILISSLHGACLNPCPRRVSSCLVRLISTTYRNFYESITDPPSLSLYLSLSLSIYISLSFPFISSFRRTRPQFEVDEEYRRTTDEQLRQLRAEASVAATKYERAMQQVEAAMAENGRLKATVRGFSFCFVLV